MEKELSREERVKALRALESYRFVSESAIPEIDAEAVTMEHVKTGARVFLLLSDDPNKVFLIGFRTPSRDSTGVAHIVEHTVLCGSEKYPSKDPFVELVKGSLNTFLNAMTYPDKTVYPVASMNDADFRNLMDVYLDAVFHPNLYREKKIFEQEGWHYEMTDPDGDLILNGVVYNEMKGVYSSADGVMERAVNSVLFKGHPYEEESGGDPENIPELTYEQYLDFHGRYYHPTNSYIYLYGDCDMASYLDYMDREYLSRYEKRPVDSVIPLPAPMEKPAEAEFPYSIAESESEEGAWYFSLNMRVGGELDPVKYTAFQALDYVLLDVPGAPLHDALIEAGIGEDVYGGYAQGIREPYFAVNVKNTGPEKKEEFLSVVRGTLKKLADEGIDRDMLYAALNSAEFRAREADFGSYPKGLMYGLTSFDSWLYDGDPTMHIRFEDVFRELREKVGQGYFEDLIRESLLDNPNEALLLFKPVSGLTGQREKALAEKLKGIRDSLSAEERQRIVAETKALKAYQSEPSPKEDLLKIPLLKREDLSREAEKPVYEERFLDGTKLLWSDVFTSGIAYVDLVFDAGRLTAEELPYMAFLRDLFSYVDTESSTYAALSTKVNLNSGGISFGADAYPELSKGGPALFTFTAGAKVLYDKIPFALDVLREILLTSKLGDRDRIREVLAEVRAGLRDRLTGAGHVAALNRAGSFLSPESFFSDATKGITYYRMLEQTLLNYDTEKERFGEMLRRTADKLFTADRMLLHLTADRKGLELFEKAAGEYAAAYPASYPEDREAEKTGFAFRKDIRREAWSSASQVNYVGRSGNFRQHGFAYTGALRILKVLLSYDYLWNNIRVLGGAYGCMAHFTRSGNAGFVSYRDPKLLETDKVYDGIADYAEHYGADEREMTKAIIGAVADLDAPKTPLTKGLRGLSAYLSHVTDADLQRERDEVLDADPESIRALAPLLRAVLSDGARCVIGNETAIRENAEAFTSAEALFKD